MKSSFLYRAYSRMKAAILMETEIDAKVAAKNAFCSMGQRCSSENHQHCLHMGPLPQIAQETAGSLQSSLDVPGSRQPPGSRLLTVLAVPWLKKPRFCLQPAGVTQSWEGVCKVPGRGVEPVCIGKLRLALIVSPDCVASPEYASSHGDKAKREGHC